MVGKQQETILYYAHDPMCSWCWGFRPVWQQVQASLPQEIRVRYLLGGLAPDTDEPMPEGMRQSIRATWKKIQKEIPGTRFNFDFWTNCLPRRSTYPACRALIATRLLAAEREADMLLAIQQAYYLQARNPSNRDVLAELAVELGMEKGRFLLVLDSPACQDILSAEIEQCRSRYMESFPSMVLKQGKSYTFININYTNSDFVLSQISTALHNP